MGASIRVGRVAGIEVRLHWSLVFVFALIAWTLATQVLPSVVPGQSQSAFGLVPLLAAFLFFVSLLSHEMGHALCGLRLKNIDPVHRVTIIARGAGAWGITMTRPLEDRYLMTEPELRDRPVFALDRRL